jgi:hypothetical protein
MILTSGVGDSIRLFFRHSSLFGRSLLARPAFGLRHERFYLAPGILPECALLPLEKSSQGNLWFHRYLILKYSRFFATILKSCSHGSTIAGTTHLRAPMQTLVLKTAL